MEYSELRGRVAGMSSLHWEVGNNIKKIWNHFGDTDSNWPSFKDVELDSRYQTFPEVELKFYLPRSAISLLLSLHLKHLLFFFFILYSRGRVSDVLVLQDARIHRHPWQRSPETRAFAGTCGKRIRQNTSPSVVTHSQPQRWRHRALAKSSYHEWQISVPVAGEKFIRVKMELVILSKWLMISRK